MDEQRLDDQLEPIYSSSAPIRDVPWKASQERWTIETGGERESGISVLAAQHDDDESVLGYRYIYSTNHENFTNILDGM